LAAVNIAGKYSSSITISHVVGKLYLISAVSVTNLALPSGNNTFVGRNAHLSWTTDASAVLGSFATASGGQSPWFRDFEVRVFNGATLVRTEYLTQNFYTYSFEKNTEDGGPRRTFTVKVRARDYYGNYSGEATITPTNPAPVNFGSVEYTPGQGIIFLKYTKPTDPDYRYTRIYASLTAGFTPGPTNLVGETTDRVTSFPAEAGTWKVRLEGVDEFGPAGVFSTETVVIVDVGTDIEEQVNAILEDPGRLGDVVVEATRFLIVSPSTTAPLTAVFGVGTIDGVAKVGIKGTVVIDGSLHGRSITANSITANRLSVSELSAVSADMGMITAGTFRTAPGTGYRVEMSDVGSFPIWYGTGTKNTTNGLFYVDTAGNAVFKGTLSGVDGIFSGTLSAATGTFAGLVSGGSINIGSGNFAVDAAGNAEAKHLTIRKPNGDIIFDINGMPGSHLNQLSVDTLRLANQAVSLRIAIESLTLNPAVNFNNYATVGFFTAAIEYHALLNLAAVAYFTTPASGNFAAVYSVDVRVVRVFDAATVGLLRLGEFTAVGFNQIIPVLTPVVNPTYRGNSHANQARAVFPAMSVFGSGSLVARQHRVEVRAQFVRAAVAGSGSTGGGTLRAGNSYMTVSVLKR
jgi:hypothetical protein